MVIPNGFILKNFLAGRTNLFKTLLKNFLSMHKKRMFQDNLTNIIKLIFVKIPRWMCRSICWPVTADDSLFIIRNANFWSFARCLPAFLIPINIGAAFVFSKTFRSICLISKWLMFYDKIMINHMMKKLVLTLATNLTSFFWSLVLIFLKIRWLWVLVACITRLIIPWKIYITLFKRGNRCSARVTSSRK